MSGIIAQNAGRHTGLVKAASAGGEWTLISTLTSDGSDADLSFTSGIDSTYDEYCFKLISLHPETISVSLTVNFSADGGSNYDVTKTSSYFRAYSAEGGGNSFAYKTDKDCVQTTGVQILGYGLGNDNDMSNCGELYLFNPASTTFLKHYVARTVCVHEAPEVHDTYVGGYLNTTSAVDAVQFKFSADEIQAGSISLYGIG